MTGRRITYAQLCMLTEQIGVESGHGASFRAALLRAGITLRPVQAADHFLQTDDWFEVTEPHDEVTLRNACRRWQHRDE